MNKEPDGKFVPEQEAVEMIRIKKKALIILFYSTPGRSLRQTAGEVFGSVTNKFAGAKVDFSPTDGD
jgi:hypothetical protein